MLMSDPPQHRCGPRHIGCAGRITHQHLCAGVRAELTDLDRADGEGGSPKAAPGGDDDLFAGQRRCREHAYLLGPGGSTRAAGVRRRHVHAERERARRRPRTAGATWSRHRDCECGIHRCDCDRRSARGGRRQSPRVAGDLPGRGRHVGPRRRGAARAGAGVVTATLRERVRVMRQPRVAPTLLVTTAWAVGTYTVYSFIASFLATATPLRGPQVGYALFLWGASAGVGVIIRGNAADKPGGRAPIP